MGELSFKGKNVLITGGTKGLGLCTAQLFARAGADVYLAYRSDQKNAEEAAKVIRALGVRCEVIESDLSHPDGIQVLFGQLRKYTQSLDIYIHNAAATAFKNLLEIEPHHIDKTFNLSVKSFILGTQQVATLMKSGGAIVTVSGMDTLRAVPRHGLLGAAKSALETLTAYFAHELAQRKIRVNGVNPGFFATDSTRKYLGPMFETVERKYTQSNPEKRPATIDEIANVILFLASDYSKWIVGQTICVDGGFNFSLPLLE